MLIVEALGAWAVLLLVACGLGVRVSKWLKLTYTGQLELVVFAIGLGFACLIGLGFALGIVGWLRPPVIQVGLIGSALIGIPSIRLKNRLIIRSAQPIITSPDLRAVRYLSWLFLAALIVLNLIGALAPETIWDAHAYHLDLPRQWLKAGSFVYIPYNFYSTWPLNLSVLYAIGMGLIEDPILPQLTHFTFGVLSMLLIYTYLRPRYGSMAALWAGVLFYSIPAMSWLSGTAISDLGIAYFTLAAVIACLHWMENGSFYWLVLAAIETGLSMGAKLTGLFTLALLVMAVVYVGFTKRKMLRCVVQQAVLVSVIALALALPWYLKSYIQTGNPIFPFGYSLFGGKYWTNHVNTRFLLQQFSFMGIGRTPLDYLLLPLRLLIPQHVPYEGPISWIFLVGVVWGFVQRHDRTVRYLSMYAIITFGLWMFFTTQQVRILLPALGALSIVLGIGLAALAARFSWGMRLVTVIMLLVMAEGAIGFWRERSPALVNQIRVLAGTLSRETYLRSYLEPADVLLFANRNLPPGGAILSMIEVRGFLSQHELIWGDPSTQAYIDYDQLKGIDALRKRLGELGVQYVLVSQPMPQLEVLQRDLQLIYKSGKYDLYHWAPEERWVSEQCYASAAHQDYCPVQQNADVILGELLPGTKFFQTFTSECANLNRIKLFLTSYDRTNTNTLNVRVKDLDAEQQLFELTIPAQEIADNQWHEIPFEPLPDSMGKHYRITLVSPDARPGNAIGIWRSATDVYPGGEALIDGKPIQADWVFQYGCSR